MDTLGEGGSPYRFLRHHRGLNLAPAIRAPVTDYFERRKITWHRHANHALSSQVNCLNFLAPLANQPKVLATVIGTALGIAPPNMLEVERGPDGTPWFVGFEWIGAKDYLNEAGNSGGRTRGANATSADAIVRFEHNGRIETVLIEWKYTESYGASIPASGNEVRRKRYQHLVFAPDGPIRANLGLSLDNFLWEPFYQMLRQQMLAFQMQVARENGAQRVRVLHISPSRNKALHAVTSPALRRFGTNAFEVFRELLVSPEDFISRTTRDVFAKAASEANGEAGPWADYLLGRYGSILDPA